MNDPFNCLIRVGSDDGVTDISYENIKISSINSEYNILKQNKETSLKRKTSKERISLEKSKNNSQENSESNSKKCKSFEIFGLYQGTTEPPPPPMTNDSAAKTSNTKNNRTNLTQVEANTFAMLMEQFKDKVVASNTSLNVSINNAGNLISDSINNFTIVAKQYLEFQHLNAFSNLCSNDLNIFNDLNKDSTKSNPTSSDNQQNSVSNLKENFDSIHDSNSNTSNISCFSQMNLSAKSTSASNNFNLTTPIVPNVTISSKSSKPLKNTGTASSYNFDDIELSIQNIETIKQKSSSGFIFAAHLMEELFEVDEYQGCNVNGNSRSKEDPKRALDPRRIAYIRAQTEKLYVGISQNKEEFWASCVKSMNRRIRELLE